MILNCIIVDDEEGAHHILESYISELKQLSLTGKFYNAMEAFYFMKQHKIDLVLLDINMPGINGFGLLDMLPNKPMVIFTTAYSAHALQGFEYNAVDYLCKPIRFERFVVAIEKALKWADVHRTDNSFDMVTLKTEGIVQQIPAADICYIESLGNYIKVLTTHKTYVAHMTMNEIEALLPRKILVRVHKSYIINMQQVAKATSEDVLINDVTIPIGKTYKKYFLELLKENNKA